MRLFEESYYGLHGSDEFRFYFEEGKYGLFVWLTNSCDLKAFQADFRSQHVLHYLRNSSLSYQTISNEPVSGGIGGDLACEDAQRLKAAVVDFDYPTLPELFRKIRAIVSGDPCEDFTLPAEEILFLKSQKIKYFDFGKSKQPVPPAEGES